VSGWKHRQAKFDKLRRDSNRDGNYANETLFKKTLENGADTYRNMRCDVVITLGCDDLGIIPSFRASDLYLYLHSVRRTKIQF